MLKNRLSTPFITLIAAVCLLSSCAYIGPPPQPEEIKSNKTKALAFLKSLPALGQRDAVVCRYGEQGIKSLAGNIVGYEQYSVTTRSVGRETIIELSLPTQRQYLSIPTTGGAHNNECVAYRYVQQQEHAFYWGKDEKSSTAKRVVDSLITLGVNKLTSTRN